MNNYRLIDICMKAGAMLIAWGEQPDNYKQTGGNATQINGEHGGPDGWLYEPGPTGTATEWDRLTLDELRSNGDGSSQPKYAEGVKERQRELETILKTHGR
jgi:hypothetical protein